MMIGTSLHFIARLWSHPTARFLILTLYYLAIILGLILMYGRGNFTTPNFIYQGF